MKPGGLGVNHSVMAGGPYYKIAAPNMEPFWEPLWSLDQSHRGPGVEPQKSLVGAFLEPGPVRSGAWYGASEEPFGNLFGA